MPAKYLLPTRDDTHLHLYSLLLCTTNHNFYDTKLEFKKKEHV